MHARLALLAVLGLTACSTSDAGGGGGEGPTSTASSVEGGVGGGAPDDELEFTTWAWLQGRFSTEPDAGTGGGLPAPKVMVGCPVDLPEIGSRAVYVEHADEGMPPDAQFVIVTDETKHELPSYIHNGVARIHRVADPAVWAGQCSGEVLAAPGAVEAEPACEWTPSTWSTRRDRG